jgi:hypothetical protein
MSVPFSENGGFASSTFYLFVPVQSGGNVYVGIFDPSNFNDPNDGSYYFYRMEDVQSGRVPVVRRIVVQYRDIGQATITVTVQGTNDNGNAVSSSITLSIGSAAATGLIRTTFADVQIACFHPQLSFSSVAGSGPYSIVSMTMIGEVEDTSL